MPTILISLFFGVFGFIPAARRSTMARKRGYSWAFGSLIGANIVLGIILPLFVLAGHLTDVRIPSHY